MVEAPAVVGPDQRPLWIPRAALPVTQTPIGFKMDPNPTLWNLLAWRCLYVRVVQGSGGTFCISPGTALSRRPSPPAFPLHAPLSSSMAPPERADHSQCALPGVCVLAGAFVICAVVWATLCFINGPTGYSNAQGHTNVKMRQATINCRRVTTQTGRARSAPCPLALLCNGVHAPWAIISMVHIVQSFPVRYPP